MSQTPRGLIIAAPASGAGKTTVALGLLRALKRSGRTVQPYKRGPVLADEYGTAASAVTGTFFHLIDGAP